MKIESLRTKRLLVAVGHSVLLLNFELWFPFGRQFSCQYSANTRISFLFSAPISGDLMLLFPANLSSDECVFYIKTTSLHSCQPDTPINKRLSEGDSHLKVCSSPAPSKSGQPLTAPVIIWQNPSTEAIRQSHFSHKTCRSTSDSPHLLSCDQLKTELKLDEDVIMKEEIHSGL